MSHYSVAVFTQNGLSEIYSLLSPYDEHIVVDPYVRFTKEQLIKRRRDELQCAYEQKYVKWQADPQAYESKCIFTEHIEFLKSLPDLLKQSDEQIYQQSIASYTPASISPEGGILSEYNPKSKWDWFEVGGRWIGMLVLKAGCNGERGTPGVGRKVSEHHDSALASDVDFEKTRQQKLANMMPYEVAMTSDLFSTAFIRTEAEYIARETMFYTYGVITPDGAWHSPGEICDCATSTETPAEEHEWVLNYFDRFIKPAIENGWHITIIDFHI